VRQAPCTNGRKRLSDANPYAPGCGASLRYSPCHFIQTSRGTWAFDAHQPTLGHGGKARTDEEVHMSTTNPAHRDARHCAQCGAMGILPLDQPAGDRGEVQDP